MWITSIPLALFCACQESLYKEDDGSGNMLWVKLCPSQKLCWGFNSFYPLMWSFLDTGSLQMSSSSDEAIRVSSSPIKLVSLQEEKSVVWRQDKRQAIQLEAKECQGLWWPVEARSSKEGLYSWSQRVCEPADIDCRLLDSGTVRQ